MNKAQHIGSTIRTLLLAASAARCAFGGLQRLSQEAVSEQCIRNPACIKTQHSSSQLPRTDSLLQEAADESDQSCYLFDGAQAGIAGHREIQVYACWQQKVHLDVLVFPLGPEFHRAVNARGHPAHCLATTCKRRGKKDCSFQLCNTSSGHRANLRWALHKYPKGPKERKVIRSSTAQENWHLS